MRALADNSVETHGLSSFGDLALPPDFPHFSYVDPDAPTGGLLSLQITNTSGNQNFDTFDTLNIYSWKGNGAAGMCATFDTLMTANGDEPDSVYGLVAQSVRVSRRQARLSLPPAARGALLRRLAGDGGGRRLLAQRAEGEGPSDLRPAPEEVEIGRSRRRRRRPRALRPNRSRDAHLIVVGMPMFSAAWWKGRDFTAATLDAPLGSGPYKVKTFEQGRFIEFARDPDYWGAKLPVNLGQNNFDRMRFEYYRERQVAFEAFKAGAINITRNIPRASGRRPTIFPPSRTGGSRRRSCTTARRRAPRAGISTPAATSSRIRASARRSASASTSSGRTRTSCIRLISGSSRTFPTPTWRRRASPGPDELKLLEPFRGKLAAAVFDEPYMPPDSDGSGVDRKLLKHAYDFARGRLQARRRSMKLPNGQPCTIEFLAGFRALQPHTSHSPEARQARHAGRRSASSTPRNTRAARRISNSTSSPWRSAARSRRATNCASSTPPQAARQHGSRNLAGIADPAVDALVETIARRVASRARHGLPRARPMAARRPLLGADVVSRHRLVAYWDVFSRPSTSRR